MQIDPKAEWEGINVFRMDAVDVKLRPKFIGRRENISVVEIGIDGVHSIERHPFVLSAESPEEW